MVQRLLFVFTIAAVLFSACGKNEVYIPDNVAPPDKTVENYVVNDYINKTYIGLTGQEPTTAQHDAAYTSLRANNFHPDNRKAFVQGILNTNAFYTQWYELARAEYLQGVDTAEIAGQIGIYELLLMDTAQAILWPLFEQEITRLENMRTIIDELYAGTLDIPGMHGRVINNSFYDEINMGTENFVVSSFQNFLFRYPNEGELEQAKLMVDNQNGILFLQTGNSKQDYVDIFFSSDEYYEGQVVYLYTKFLFRQPSSSEQAYFTDFYNTSGDFKALVTEILSLNEYAGI